MIQRIQQAHALYCRLTGQRVSLRFDRERLWYSSSTPVSTRRIFSASSAISSARFARAAETSVRSSFQTCCNWIASKRTSISARCGFTPLNLPALHHLAQSRLLILSKPRRLAGALWKSWPASVRSRECKPHGLSRNPRPASTPYRLPLPIRETSHRPTRHSPTLDCAVCPSAQFDHQSRCSTIYPVRGCCEFCHNSLILNG